MPRHARLAGWTNHVQPAFHIAAAAATAGGIIVDVKDWEIILALHETMNVTKAARKLFMTQPALSLRLKNIEQYFNTTLVLRGNKGVQFTQEGEFLLKMAREQIKTIAHIHDTLTNMRDTVSGIIRIGSTNYNTKYFLPLMLRAFKEAYPLAEFRVSTGVSKDIVSMVHNNDVHVGLIRGVFPWDGERHLLFKEQLLVVNQAPFRLEDLPSMPLIHYQIAPSNQEQLDKWWDERFTAPPSVTMVVDRADTCLELIAQGFGFGFLPASILVGEDGLACRKMRFLSKAPVERFVWAILHKDTRQLRLVDAFVRMVCSLEYSSLFWDGGETR